MLWLIIAVFIAKELTWAYLIPPSQAPDELAHLGYVQELASGRIPKLGESTFTEFDFEAGEFGYGGWNRETGRPYINWIAQHPPLYYSILTPFYLLAGVFTGDTFLILFFLRFITVLLGAVALYFLGRTAVLISRDEVLPALLLIGVSFFPGYSFTASLLNNDNLVIALSSMVFFLYARAAGEKKNASPWLVGLLLGLLALTKITALPLLVAVLFYEVWKGTNRLLALRRIGLILALFLLVSGWWFPRNYFVYGTVFPDLQQAVSADPGILNTFPDLPDRFPEVLQSGASGGSVFDFFINQNFLKKYYRNFWGVFGIPAFNLPDWLWWGIIGFTFMSLGGAMRCAYAHVKAKQKQENPAHHGGINRLFLLSLLITFTFLAAKLFTIFQDRGFLGAMHGRYLYHLLLPFMAFFFGGLSLLSGKHARVLLAVFCLFLVIADFWNLTNLLMPEFF